MHPKQRQSTSSRGIQGKAKAVCVQRGPRLYSSIYLYTSNDVLSVFDAIDLYDLGSGLLCILVSQRLPFPKLGNLSTLLVSTLQIID